MNGKLICNTGPLVALSMIDRIDILRRLFKLVAVPEAVHKEILEGGPINAGLSNYRKAKWIKVMTLSNPTDPLLKTSLDAGEAAVIELAREMNADLVLIDERKARKIARTIYGLHVVGSARVLVEAKRRGLLDNVGGALQAMRDGGYRLGDSIVDVALKQAGET
jgi:predicted nucleic acid-binding protein